jgi:formylglycine-generating enzyme required for sulfatase activity
VAKRNANSLNLFDLHGNVWEWVSGSPAMLKGGSWNDNLRSSQIDNHMKLDPAIPFALAGCRLVMEVRR